MVLFERLTFAMSNVSIATNESYKRVAVSRGKMKPENVYVVRSAPRRAWIDRAANPDSAEKLVGYVGVMGAQEGLDLLLEAAHHIVYTKKRDDVRFVLVGDGSARRDLEAQAAALNLSDHVRFTGRVSDAELKDWLGRSTVLVNPDRPSELNDKSTMNKIVEYMAMAKPIVQFECTEGRFSAQDASLYAKPNDVQDFAAKIEQLLDDPTLAKQLGEYGRERFESELCWEHQEPKLLAAYAAALGRAPARDAALASNTSA
jgi:glycosyltransferase involved in cell wall biosynthesis